MCSPDEPTTPTQLAVIAWSMIALLVIGGAVAMYFAIAGAAKNPALAAEVRLYAYGMWALAAAIFGLKRVIVRWLE